MDDDHRVALAGVADIVSKVMIQKAFSCEHNGLKRKRDADTTVDSEGEGLAGDDEDGLEGNDGGAGEGGFADANPPRLPGDDVLSNTDSDSEESDDEEDPSSLVAAACPVCPVCDLATSELVQAMDACSDRLAGQVGESRLCAIQLEIWQKRVAPLRAQGRSVPLMTTGIIRKHYSRHRINVVRSLAVDIRVLECMQKTLRRTGLCDYDQDNNRVLSHRASSEMCKISKQKTDLLKFYNSLTQQRKKEETQNN